MLSVDSLLQRFGCRVNEIPIAELFHRYEECGFLYAEKKENLTPYWQTIVENWSKLQENGSKLLQIFSVESSDGFGSVVSWRHTTNGNVAQHLVASGGPKYSRLALLAAQAITFEQKLYSSASNWFQPDHPIAKRLFGSFVTVYRHQHACLDTFDYGHFKPMGMLGNTNGRIQELNAANQNAILDFLRIALGPVAFHAEELEDPDLGLTQLHQLYARVDLRRYRKFFAACSNDGKIIGVAIAYRGPLGLNFSFLENRSEFYLDPTLKPQVKWNTFYQLLASIQIVYQDFTPPFIPVVTRIQDQIPILSQRAPMVSLKWKRQYCRTFWLAPLFHEWYRHIEHFYARRFGIEGHEWNPAS